MRLILAILPTMLLVVYGQLVIKWRVAALSGLANPADGPLGRLVSYLGGWVNYRRRDAPETKPPPAPRAKTRGRQQQRQQQSPLELVEREIARSEERVAELERQLAEDWTNVDLLTAHRAARDDLEALLARWESLFES